MPKGLIHIVFLNHQSLRKYFYLLLLLQSESDQKGSDACGGGGHHSAGSAMCVWKSYIIVLGL